MLKGQQLWQTPKERVKVQEPRGSALGMYGKRAQAAARGCSSAHEEVKRESERGARGLVWAGCDAWNSGERRLRAPIGRGLGFGDEKMAKGDLILWMGGLEGLGWGNKKKIFCQVGSRVLNNLMWKVRSIWPTLICCHVIPMKTCGQVCALPLQTPLYPQENNLQPNDLFLPVSFACHREQHNGISGFSEVLSY